MELLESNLRILRQKIKPDMKLSAMQGNALDLSAFKDNTYDLTLLLGPMYHLFTEEDKLQALSEAIRVTRRGGVIFKPSVLLQIHQRSCKAPIVVFKQIDGFLIGNATLLAQNFDILDGVFCHSGPS